MDNSHPNRKITLADVAHYAAVSISTASRALNEHPAIKAETRDRVVAAAKALGYVQVSKRHAQVPERTDSPFASQVIRTSPFSV